MHFSQAAAANLTFALAAFLPNNSFNFNPFFTSDSNSNFNFKMATLSHNHTHNGWHAGERTVHSLLRVHTSARGNPTSPGLPYSYGMRVASSPLLAVGTLDSQGRPWSTLWYGERGFARMVAQGVLGVQSLVGTVGDPVVEALGLGGEEEGGMVKPEGGKMMSALSIDLESRDRVKLMGRMVVGALGDGEGGVREVQVAMAVEGSLGNCPKYLNTKVVRGRVATPRLVGREEGRGWLGEEALGVVDRADMFFLSSVGGGSMDTNHRGGPRGFVRVLRNDEGGTVLVYPEYSGNQLYQTLGNLQQDAKVGVVIPDFETSDVLYLTGVTELLVGERAAAVMPHAKLAVKITVVEARLVRDGLTFGGEPGESSPYNPPVRRLAGEGSISGEAGGTSLATAKLVKKEALTPSVTRFTFSLQVERGRSLKPWRAGQYVTLDFSEELDHGWSHMRDDDPQSLNDDFVRTFTVSSQPPEAGPNGDVKNGTELQITARRNGPATGLLWRQNVRAHLELPVLAFGGEASFSMLSGGEKKAVFVAGGVGITPLLAQASQVLSNGRVLSLLWSLRAKDLGLAVDTFDRAPGLAELTQLFVTGSDGSQDEVSLVAKVESQGALVVRGRIAQSHLLDARGGEKGTKYYLCTSPELLNVIQDWVEGEEVVTESFNY
ncbi:hypothetical protein B0T16DRAFT_419024 [Cercophora newfieldiana]|uniref:FAD-binding FR-type domain-containing protein n=1 Tax=Cercophora newfieldiana TaxID=92897 RepID=A0AA39XWE6_9PEZI|nr:hypothetical protein B0T16DRAFT_419024 [Cercophora newfieldiana]